MRCCTIWWLTLAIACAGKSERSAIEQYGCGCSEESETPMFGGQLDDVTNGLVLNARSAGPRAEPTKPSEVKTWKRAQIVPNTSRLKVGDKEELPLKAMQATVHIDGFRARVVLDCVYENDRDEELEGTFQLRLPNEASPYYLGFGQTAPQRLLLPAAAPDVASIRTTRKEVWSKTKEARVVPKEKAAFAYGETVRKSIDPALLEWSGAGVFATRVFPLEPGKLHRIVVGYEVNLVPVGEDLEYRLDLPENVEELKVDIEVRGAPHVVKPSKSARNPAARTFVVRLKRPGPTLLRGEDPKLGPFFAAQLAPRVPEALAKPSARGVFLVDVSLSANPERFNVWLKLLAALLEKNRPALKEFAVGFFNIETFWWRDGFHANTPANVNALLEYANTLALEGATDLGQALRTATHLDGRYDLFCLSDGAATWGEDDAQVLALTFAKGALFAYNAGFQGTDARLLGSLARETGGAVFSVVGEAEIDRAATAHTLRPWRIATIRLKGGKDVLLEGRPAALYPGQVLRLAGRGKPERGAVVSLTLEQDGKEHVVETALDRVIESDLAAGLYGQIAVGQLEELGPATEAQSRAYATHFRVVGKTCSLLMLETKEDYERFDIRPREDARVIRRERASDVVQKTLRAKAQELGDPKASFRHWLARLQRAPGLELALPRRVRRALDEMPAESFRVTPDPLACRARLTSDVPGAVQEELASRKLTYDSITKEAERRREKNGSADALRVLSSLVEHSPGDTALAGDVGYTALGWGLGGQAYHLFRRVANARPFEPHSYHAMALCLTELNKTDLALLCYEVAWAGTWHARFGDFHRIVGFDYLRFLRRIEAQELQCSVPDLARTRLKELRRSVRTKSADLVIAIAWNTDRSDVDLHVIDPHKEECYYSNPETQMGGRLTQDVTQGYGPEMFVLKRATPGTYRVRVNYYSSASSRVSTRTKVYATIYENWGRNDERVTRKIVTLAYRKDKHDIARVRWE